MRRTPHRSHGKGTFVIDRSFRGVGRICRSSGTEDPKLFGNLNHMLDTLAQGGRQDVLEQVREGMLTPLQVWQHYRLGRWDDVPTVQHLQPLIETVHRWALAYVCSEEHREKDLLRSLTAITPHVRVGATVAEIPESLERYRGVCEARETHRTFNIVRSTFQAFLRSTLAKRRRDPLYQLTAAVEPLPVGESENKHPQTVEQAREVMQKLGARDGAYWWSLCVTGMNPKEYFSEYRGQRGRFAVEAGRVRIWGTKRPGRSWNGKGRLVPLVSLVVRPACTANAFAQALKRAEVVVTPQDGRRTFMNWLEHAGVIRTHRKLYLGHGARDVSDIYERHEVEEFLAEDGKRLRAFLGEPGHLQIMGA